MYAYTLINGYQSNQSLIFNDDNATFRIWLQGHSNDELPALKYLKMVNYIFL